MEKTNFCHLTKDVLIQILLKVNTKDLLNVSLVTKKCSKIVQSDKFWFFKVLTEYSEFAEKKLERLTWLEWYQRLKNSGDFYITDTKEWYEWSITNPKLYGQNVIRGQSGDIDFYITIFDELYVDIKTANNYLRKYISRKDDAPTFVKVLDNVTDIGFFTGGYMWLNDKGELIYDDKVIGYNYKKIIYDSEGDSICLLTTNNQLELLTLFQDEPHFEIIDQNVSMAVFVHIKNIYYVRQNGELWLYYPETRKIFATTLKLGNKPEPIKTRKQFKKVKLIAEGVKSVAGMDDYILLVGIDDQLWIYPNRYTERDYEYEYDDNVEFEPYPSRNRGKGKLHYVTGWNQDRYHELKIAKIMSDDKSFSFLDHQGNLYTIRRWQIIDKKLSPDVSNIISFSNGDTITFITPRDVGPVVNKIILDKNPSDDVFSETESADLEDDDDE